MLTVENVVVTQGAFSLTANFTIEAGARVAVIGPSGGGKSTLLNAVAGFVKPASGRMIWQGENLNDLSPAQRPISILFQDNNLFPHMSVLQNVGLGLRPDLKLSGDENQRVLKALQRVGLQGFEDKKPAALSGGQASRVALARMLLRAKSLVLLDEPFAALGPALRDEMLDLVAELMAEIGATLMMVSHNPDDAKRIADSVILVSDGVANMPVETSVIFDSPPEALRDYLG